MRVCGVLERKITSVPLPDKPAQIRSHFLRQESGRFSAGTDGFQYGQTYHRGHKKIEKCRLHQAALHMRHCAQLG